VAAEQNCIVGSEGGKANRGCKRSLCLGVCVRRCHGVTLRTGIRRHRSQRPKVPRRTHGIIFIIKRWLLLVMREATLVKVCKA
jgi:hypothetical protein